MDYIKSVTLFLVFIAFLENVLVLGNMKKYIRLFCGIILIFIILQPISYIFGEEFDVSNILELSDIEDRMSELNENVNQSNTIIEMIENNVSEIVELQGYELTYILVTMDSVDSSIVKSINVSVKEKDSEIIIERITISEDTKDTDTDNNSEELAEKIAGAYDIEKSNVVVNIE